MDSVFIWERPPFTSMERAPLSPPPPFSRHYLFSLTLSISLEMSKSSVLVPGLHGHPVVILNAFHPPSRVHGCSLSKNTQLLLLEDKEPCLFLPNIDS